MHPDMMDAIEADLTAMAYAQAERPDDDSAHGMVLHFMTSKEEHRALMKMRKPARQKKQAMTVMRICLQLMKETAAKVALDEPLTGAHEVCAYELVTDLLKELAKKDSGAAIALTALQVGGSAS